MKTWLVNLMLFAVTALLLVGLRITTVLRGRNRGRPTWW